MKILVTGLENSCGKVVSKILAQNLKVEGHEEYDGNMRVLDDNHLVSHMSLPSGERTFFFIPKIKDWDAIIVVTRDYNCALESKVRTNQTDRKFAIQENEKGLYILSGMMKFDNVHVFSYESWFLLGDAYVSKILKNIGIEYTDTLQAENCNEKYINETVYLTKEN